MRLIESFPEPARRVMFALSATFVHSRLANRHVIAPSDTAAALGEATYMEQRGNREARPEVSIVRRLGSTPQQRGSQQGMNCPDIFALSDGRIAYIGTDLTDALRHRLPDGASIGSHERIVALPLQAVLDAMPDIPTGQQ